MAGGATKEAPRVGGDAWWQAKGDLGTDVLRCP